MPNYCDYNACTVLHKYITHMDFKYPINYSNVNKQGDISIKAITVGEWGFALEAQTKCMVRSSQR